ncbi:MAG TPA: nicotinate-nucleotide adenylyltransferase [Bacillales bacterium]|nr:nicotinate-nucleotide adenylyltransferase [Bacillales bacterium]
MDIAIFGGTFDPPHYGHLMIAEEVLCACSLDAVWFMPSPIPPHKTGKMITDSRHRIEMVRLAIADNEEFHLSLLEFERKGPSYTIDTIQHLVENHPDDRFYFLIGADMVEDLPNWHRADELVRLVTFIGVGRPGFSLKSEYADSIREVKIPEFEVSASFLRSRFRENGNTRYLLPDKVRKYIGEKGLYGQENRVGNR